MSDATVHAGPDDWAARFHAVCYSLVDAIVRRPNANLNVMLLDFTRCLDLAHVSCLSFGSNRSQDGTILSALMTYSKAWQVRYFARNYASLDPVVLFGIRATGPYDWGDLRGFTPSAAGYFQDAAEHGVGRNGLTIPIRRNQANFALVSLTSNLSDPDWEVYKKTNGSHLNMLACLIYVAASLNTKLSSRHVDLSKREHEALLWAARGKTGAESAKLMNVSYRSVRSYLENARVKLGSENVTHAVAVALAIGLIPGRALKGEDASGYTGGNDDDEASNRETPNGRSFDVEKLRAGSSIKFAQARPLES